MINLYNMDCMEALQAAPDNYWDLAIVDPPYGIQYQQILHSTGNKKGKLKPIHKNITWDKKPSPEYFTQLKRVSKKQIIWGANYFNCFSNKGGALIWYKNRGGMTLSQAEIAAISFQKKVDYVYMQILTGFVQKEKNIHPTQKPVALYTWLLSKYAKKGDKILDTHLGSGSSAIAAHKAGYDFWGYEIDKDYFKAASKRLKEVQKQLLLF